MLEHLKTRKKLVIAITLGVLIIILLLLPSKTPKTTEPLPPQINIPAFNPNVNPTAEADLPPETQPKTVAVFEPVKWDRSQFMEFFDPIATDLKFSGLPEDITIDKIPHLFWQNSPSFLTVNLTTGGFNLDLHFPDLAASSDQVPETDALLFTQNWLSQYNLTTADTQHQTRYFTNVNNELVPTSDPSLAQVYLFSFTPAINNLPIFTTDSFDAPITVTVDKYGNIVSIYYRLPTLFFAQKQEVASQQKPVLTLKQINQAIADKQPVITAVNFSDGNFAPSTANLNHLSYNQITLGYSNDFSLGYFLPVFQLTGTATLDGGESVIVTAYLPALAE